LTKYRRTFLVWVTKITPPGHVKQSCGGHMYNPALFMSEIREAAFDCLLDARTCPQNVQPPFPEIPFSERITNWFS